MAPLLRKQSDDKAFERLYERHVKDVFRYSLAVLGERADAEDVTQTTFLNAYRAFQRGERPEKPENWLIAIAHNVCRQRFRQQQRRPSEVEFEDELGGAIEPDDAGPSVDELRRAFAALPPNQRAALVMRELEGRRYDEIAEVLGITVSALETLLFRARRALREQLEEQLSCREAAFAISKQMDGRLTAGERKALRAHLRGCPECAELATSQRAQRKALRTLLAVPLPQSLQTFWPHAAETAGGGVAAGGTALAVKAAAVVAAGSLVGGGTYEGVKHVPPLLDGPRPAAARHAAAPTPLAAKPAVAHAVRVAVAKAAPARHAALPKREHAEPSQAAPARKPAAPPAPPVSLPAAAAPHVEHASVVHAAKTQHAASAKRLTRPKSAHPARPAVAKPKPAKQKKRKTRPKPAYEQKAAHGTAPAAAAQQHGHGGGKPAQPGNGNPNDQAASTSTAPATTTTPTVDLQQSDLMTTLPQTSSTAPPVELPDRGGAKLPGTP